MEACCRDVHLGNIKAVPRGVDVVKYLGGNADVVEVLLEDM